MSTPITGLRVAISGLEAASNPLTAPVVDVMEFNAGLEEGIELLGVTAQWGKIDRVAGAAAQLEAAFAVELHLEESATGLEIYDYVQNGVDQSGTNINSEILYVSHAQIRDIEDQVNGQGAAGLHIDAPMLWFPPDARPITAQNLTTRLSGDDPNFIVNANVFVYYRWVKLSRAELGFLLSNRR